MRKYKYAKSAAIIVVRLMTRHGIFICSPEINQNLHIEWTRTEFSDAFSNTQVE
jgi:hypothetical protein